MTEGHLTVALLLLMIILGLAILPEDVGTPLGTPATPAKAVQDHKPELPSRTQPMENRNPAGLPSQLRAIW